MELPESLSKLSAEFLVRSRQLKVKYGSETIIDEKVDSAENEDTDFWHGAEIEGSELDFNLSEEVSETAMSLCVYPVKDGFIITDMHRVKLEILPE